MAYRFSTNLIFVFIITQNNNHRDLTFLLNVYITVSYRYYNFQDYFKQFIDSRKYHVFLDFISKC
jgi:hypothetical protein